MKTATAKRSGTTYGEGDVVVLRGLVEDARNPKSSARPPAIGIIKRVLDDGRALVRLRMGGFSHSQGRFCPRARLVLPENISRAATSREEELGFVTGAAS
jgi:hypothetical protein